MLALDDKEEHCDIHVVSTIVNAKLGDVSSPYRDTPTKMKRREEKAGWERRLTQVFDKLLPQVGFTCAASVMALHMAIIKILAPKPARLRDAVGGSIVKSLSEHASWLYDYNATAWSFAHELCDDM